MASLMMMLVLSFGSIGLLCILVPLRPTCLQQATGYHEIVTVLNAEGTGVLPPLFGHGYREECLVLDTGVFTAEGTSVSGTLYRYTAPSILPSLASDARHQTACWSGTRFLDTTGEIPRLLAAVTTAQAACPQATVP